MNAKTKLNKMESTPAIQRLGLIREFANEELQILAEIRGLISQHDTIHNPLEIFSDLLNAFKDEVQRIIERKTLLTSRGVPWAHCGTYNITFDTEYHADEFTLLDRIHKAMLAAGVDPVIELAEIAKEWEGKTNAAN